MTRRLKILLATLMVAAVGAGVWLMIRLPRPPLDLPEFDRAVWTRLSRGGVTQGELAEARLSELRLALKSARPDPQPMKWEVWGQLELYRGGRPVAVVELFKHSSGGPDPLSYGKNYYLCEPGILRHLQP